MPNATKATRNPLPEKLNLRPPESLNALGDFDIRPMLIPTGDMQEKGKAIARFLLVYREKFQRLASSGVPSHRRFGQEIDTLISDFDLYRAKLPSFLVAGCGWKRTSRMACLFLRRKVRVRVGWLR